MTKISLAHTTEQAEGVWKAVTLLWSNPVRGKAVMLKPNFNSADAAPGSTHSDTLRGLVMTLQEMGATRVTLTERSEPGNSTSQVMGKKGIFDLSQELGLGIKSPG